MALPHNLGKDSLEGIVISPTSSGVIERQLRRVRKGNAHLGIGGTAGGPKAAGSQAVDHQNTPLHKG